MLKGTMGSGRAARWQQTSRSATSHKESLCQLRSRDEANRLHRMRNGTEVTALLPPPSGKAGFRCLKSPTSAELVGPNLVLVKLLSLSKYEGC